MSSEGPHEETDVSCLYLSSIEGGRTLWARNRSKSFWMEVVLGQWTELEWKENFRLSKSTFQRLCQDLRHYIQKDDTNYRKAIRVEHCSLALECLP